MADYDQADLDSFAFQIVGRFAVAQQSIDEAVSVYLTSRLDDRVATLMRKRLRLSDAERLDYALALAESVRLRFPAKPFAQVYKYVQQARNVLAHGGTFTMVADEDHGGVMLSQWSPIGEPKTAAQFHEFSLRLLMDDAAWLTEWAWQIARSVVGDESDTEILPSDVPTSHTFPTTFPSKVDENMPHCELGHGATEAIGTHFGDAARCLQCRVVRLLQIT